MQKNIRVYLLVAISVVLFSACNKTNKQGMSIPKDAAVVLHIDGKLLSSKLPWEEIKQNPMFQQMYTDSTVPAFVKQALDNPDNSGIDIKTDMAFFAQKDSAGGIIAFTGAIKDAEKFKLFCLELTKGGSQTEKDGISFISKSPICVGWNKEKFVIINNAPQLDMKAYMNNQSRDLLSACKNIFDLKESNSLGDDEKFTALVKKSGDLHFWMNAEQLNKSGLSNPAMAMMNLNKLTEGAITTATINFENGKILIDVKSYAGKDLTELYKKYEGKNIDEDMIKRLPIKDVAGVFAMNFKPEGIKEFLKLLGVDGYANMGLAFVGFSLDDFLKANKGDLLIAFGDFKRTTDNAASIKDTLGAPITMPSFNTKPDVIFATSIGDKDAFNLLIKAGEKFGKNVPAEFPITYNSNGKYFAIGSSKENIDKYFANGSNNNYDFISKINGNPFGGYINFQYLMKTFESDAAKDSSAKVIYDASVKVWDNAYMKGGNYDDGGLTQSIEVNLMDKNANSLKQLNQYFGLLSKLKMEQDKKRHAIMIPDEEGGTIYPPLSSLGDSTKANK
jgi:hypothetical protein